MVIKMRYNYYFWFWFLFLILGCSSHRNNDVILKAERIVDPNNIKISDTLTDLKKTNKWYETYPKLNGIPDSLENISFLYTHVNYDQVAFQGYKAGKLDKDFIEHLILKWGIDTTKCVDKPIYSFLCALTGKTKSGWYYIFDTNVDYDLSDEMIHPFKSSGDMFFSDLIHTVYFERYINKEIIKDSVKFKIDFARQADNNLLNRIYIKYVEYRKAFLYLDNEEIIIEIFPDYLRYDENPDIKIINSDSTLKIQKITIGEFVLLNNSFYRIADIPEDGNSIILRKQKKNKNELFSTQVGFKAIPIKGITLTSDTLSLNDFQGKYLLLYFWNSTCAASTFSLENSINLVYEKFDSEKFKMLGIAVDKFERTKDYVEEYNIQWPQIITQGNSKICKNYRINHYPTVYLIDPNGIIIAKEIEKSIKSIKEYVDLIEQYLL